MPRGVGLRTVRNRPANWVIAAQLMLQLAIGLQGQVARALAPPPERQMNGMEAGHCPGHASVDSTIDEGGGAGKSTSAPSSDNPAKKHDCCRSLGCQCHCAQTPGVLGSTRSRAAFSAWTLVPVFDAQPPVTRTNELFRPPIA
jgi:hypothetical protein